MIKLKETYERMFGPLIVEGNKDYYFHSKKNKRVVIHVRDAGKEFVVFPQTEEALKVKANFKKLDVDPHGTQMFSKKEVLKKLRKDKAFYEDNS
jgi:hypothetical protein